MAEKQILSNEQRRMIEAERIWLNYFNQTLFEKGIISESLRNRMKNKINGRKAVKV